MISSRPTSDPAALVRLDSQRHLVYDLLSDNQAKYSGGDDGNALYAREALRSTDRARSSAAFGGCGMTPDPIVISGYARTPMGAFQGELASVPATALGATVIAAAIERSRVDPASVERAYMGCVLPGALGSAPARQASTGGGLPFSVEATTVNKMCGSGMQAAIMAWESIVSGSIDIAVAGGMESMTNAPYMLTRHRAGARIGHDAVKDSMYLDALEDAFTPGKLMGNFAEDAARERQLSREAQDVFATRSLDRARAAIADGAFEREIVPVAIAARAGAAARTVSVDEQPGRANREGIPSLRPAFGPGGTITAANASSISDGAAAMVVARASVADRLGMPVAARIVAHAAHAHAPALFTTAPAPAIRKVLAKAGWQVGDVDLFEINEAFAVVAMIAATELRIPAEKLNIHGGATALGHPVGASGARIMATLIAALERTGGRRGVACLCLGGGEATAMAIELI